MVTLQTMDIIFYEAQRQGRISFYLTSIGEEAINIASAAALTMDDIVLPQVRDQTRALSSSSLLYTDMLDALLFLVYNFGKNLVQRTWCTFMARFYSARIC